MKTLLAAALALTVLAPAAVQADSPACDVSVQFGSYAMGIDGRAYEKVQRYIAHHPRLILTSSVMSWGREGEKTVCLTTFNGRNGMTTVFHDIRTLVGKGQRGPVEVRTLDGRVWRSNPGTGR
ncbi:MAG: hypothetical protein HY859_08880 [Caulobacterales bacterium]|nr:hypothetical protein [Caulobacterales bacterium]